MKGIFICYRREDSATDAEYLFDLLVRRFGKERVFIDVNNIPPGDNYLEKLQDSLSRCDVMFVLIGPQWPLPRLSELHDSVAMEIGSGLKRKIRVIPLLLRNAPMPASRDLPAGIKPLALCQAVKINDRLSVSIQPVLASLNQARPFPKWLAGALALCTLLLITYFTYRKSRPDGEGRSEELYRAAISKRAPARGRTQTLLLVRIPLHSSVKATLLFLKEPSADEWMLCRNAVDNAMTCSKADVTQGFRVAASRSEIKQVGEEMIVSVALTNQEARDLDARLQVEYYRNPR